MLGQLVSARVLVSQQRADPERLSLELAALPGADEEVAKMSGEAGGVDGVRIESRAVTLLDELEDLADERRLGEGLFHAGGAGDGVEEVHGEGHRLALGELDVESLVEPQQQPLGDPEFLGVQVRDFGAHGVLHHLAAGDAFDRLVDVVGGRHDRERGEDGAERADGVREEFGDQRESLGRDVGEDAGDGVRVVGGDEATGDQ